MILKLSAVVRNYPANQYKGGFLVISVKRDAFFNIWSSMFGSN